MTRSRNSKTDRTLPPRKSPKQPPKSPETPVKR